jgi:Flp pilus assembly protein TadG
MTGQDGQTSTAHGTGQALVEMAMALPLLLLFILGIVLFGRVFGARAAVTAAAREAARVDAEASARDRGLSLARERAVDVITGYGLSASHFTLTIDDGGFAHGGTVTAQASYTVPILDLPVAGKVVRGPSVTVQAVDRERIELYRARAP